VQVAFGCWSAFPLTITDQDFIMTLEKCAGSLFLSTNSKWCSAGFVAASLSLILVSNATAGPIIIRHSVSLTPPADANDLHYYFWQKEADAAMVDGTVKIGVGGDPNPAVNIGDPNPPAVQQGAIPADGPLPAQTLANTWVKVDFETDNGAAFDNPLIINFEVALKDENRIRTQGYWTFDGESTEVAQTTRSAWSWGPATLIGDDAYKHIGKIYNDNPTQKLFLKNLTFFADMRFLDFDTLVFGPDYGDEVWIDPLSFFQFELSTTGSMIGGYIYFTYELSQGPLLEATGLQVQALAQETTEKVVGRHPIIDIPTPAPWTLLLFAPVALGLTRALASRRKVRREI
jgi:hypothetical protein